jgi:hypothetical protein
MADDFHRAGLSAETGEGHLENARKTAAKRSNWRRAV